MKTLLGLTTLVLTALILEEKARQVAGDAKDAYGEALVQGRQATEVLAQKIKQQPLISLLVAGGVAYVLASIVPRRV